MYQVWLYHVTTTCPKFPRFISACHGCTGQTVPEQTPGAQREHLLKWELKVILKLQFLPGLIQ